MSTRERIRSIEAALNTRLGVRVSAEVVRELALDIYQAISDAAVGEEGREIGVKTFIA